MKLNTRDIVYIGFIAALCAVATTIRIEIPVSYTHLDVYKRQE